MPGFSCGRIEPRISEENSKKGKKRINFKNQDIRLYVIFTNLVFQSCKMGDVTRPLSRDEQIEKLRLVLGGGPGISVPETIFLHGLGATGRTIFINKTIFLSWELIVTPAVYPRFVLNYNFSYFSLKKSTQ